MTCAHRSTISLSTLFLLCVGTACRREPEPISASFEVRGSTVVLDLSSPRPLRFDVVSADEAAPPAWAPVPGRVVTVDALTAPHFASLPGRVATVSVRPGDRVKRGDRLVEIVTSELASLHEEQRSAALAVRTRELALERARQLAEARLGTAQDVVVAEAELAEARLRAQASQARLGGLSLAKVSSTSYWIVASADGDVVQVDAKPGLMVGPDRERPLLTVAQLDRLWVLADVSLRDAASLAAGDPASLSLAGSGVPACTAIVDSVASIVDGDRQTVPVRIAVGNEARVLRPNTFVDVVFNPQSNTRTLQVPTAALVTDGAATSVFVQAGDGSSFERRSVKLGRQSASVVEILEGVKRGERVVTRGALLLANAVREAD
jgi:cobalt-zinc-cadmium efflux system membrane fusion protein